MKPYRTAAAYIGNVLEGRLCIGPAWDALDSETIAALQSRWALAMEINAENAIEVIIENIQSDPVLGPAWEQCGSAMRENLRVVIDVFVSDTR